MLTEQNSFTDRLCSNFVAKWLQSIPPHLKRVDTLSCEIHFSTDAYCGRTAGWMKMPLGTTTGLGSGHILLDGDPASPQMGKLVCRTC